MTDEEINIKIAEFMGLDVQYREGVGHYIQGRTLNDCTAIHNIPSYCNDLNLVWEVEERMFKKEHDCIEKYSILLHDIFSSDRDVRLFKSEHIEEPLSGYLIYEKFAGQDMPTRQVIDYCHDLNAVWEVIKNSFKSITCYGMLELAHATAKQRCEAIVKVIEGSE